jgi:hypothetical protein
MVAIYKPVMQQNKNPIFRIISLNEIKSVVGPKQLHETWIFNSKTLISNRQNNNNIEVAPVKPILSNDSPTNMLPIITNSPPKIVNAIG